MAVMNKHDYVSKMLDHCNKSGNSTALDLNLVSRFTKWLKNPISQYSSNDNIETSHPKQGDHPQDL